MDQHSLPHNLPPVTKPRPAIKHDVLDDDDDMIYSTRMPSSTRRYRSDVKMEVGRAPADVLVYGQNNLGNGHKTIPPRRTAGQIDATRHQPTHRRTDDAEDVSMRQSGPLALSLSPGQRPPHWLILAGIGLLIMLAGWLMLNGVANWWHVTQDDWHYGRPRTYQIDFVVGHNDSATNPSHFIALNLRRQVEIIEIAGNDAATSRIYTGPLLIGADQDLAIVTLTFKDVNGDGKPDMIVNIQDSHFVFINDIVHGSPQFRPVHPGERIQM